MDTLLAFIILLALSAVFASLRGVGGAAASLLAVSTAMVYFSVALVAGVLVPAGWVFCAAVAALLALVLWRRRAGLWQKLLAPGFLLFAGGGLVLMLYFGLRQPVFTQWDEFSFWGVAVKLLCQNGASYAHADTGFFTTMTQSPGLPVLGWFAQFFGGGFAQWKVYWADAALLLAAISALSAALAPRHWRVALPLLCAGLLLPFFFEVPYHTVFLATPWLSAYGDLPAGMVFGGALALYFAARGGGGHTARWAAALPLAALALMKENTLPVALVAAGLMAADGLFFGVPAPGLLATRSGSAEKWEHGPRKWALRAGIAVAWFIPPAVLYQMWSRHAGAAAALNPLYQATEGQTNLGIGEAAVLTLRQLLRPEERTGPMALALEELGANFTGATLAGGPGTFKVSMAGSPLATVVVIVLVFALAALLAGGLRQRLRVVVSGALLCGGFAAYHFMLLMFWGVMDRVGDGVKDYGRYLSSYTTGWLMLGLTLLAMCALPDETKKPAKEGDEAPKALTRRWAAAAVMLAVCLCMVARFAVLVRPGYSVLDYPDTAFQTEKAEMAIAEEMRGHIEPGGRVFFVHQGAVEDTGDEFGRYHLYFLPTVVDYSITGGWQLRPPSLAAEGAAVERSPTRQQLADYLETSGCDYIFIEKIDEAFIEVYGALFAPGLESWAGPTLYHKNAQGLYAPV